MAFVPDHSANFGERTAHRCGVCNAQRVTVSFRNHKATVACAKCGTRKTVEVSTLLPLAVEAKLLRFA